MREKKPRKNNREKRKNQNLICCWKWRNKEGKRWNKIQYRLFSSIKNANLCKIALQSVVHKKVLSSKPLRQTCFYSRKSLLNSIPIFAPIYFMRFLQQMKNGVRKEKNVPMFSRWSIDVRVKSTWLFSVSRNTDGLLHIYSCFCCLYRRFVNVVIGRAEVD